MGLWDDYDDEAKISDQLPNLRDGDYLVYMQNGTDNKTREGKFYVKLFMTVLKVTEDMGDCNKAGEEVGVAIFRNPAFKYFESETKALVKAADNLSKKEANALKKIQVRRFISGTPKNPGSKLPGRVMEVKVRQVVEKAKKADAEEDEEDEKPKKKKHKEPLRRFTPLRCLTAEEVMAAGISKKLLKRVFPKGPKSITQPANAASED